MATVGQKLGKNDLEVQLAGRRKVSKELSNKCLHPKTLHKRCPIRFSDDDATKNVDIFVGIDSSNNDDDDDVKGGAVDSSVVIAVAVVDSQQVFLLVCL